MSQQGSDKPYKDPLRELILMTEDSSTKVDETYATNLAKEASVLTHIKEIHLESKPISKPTTVITQPEQQAQPIAAAAPAPTDVTNLSTMFQDKTDMIDPVKEREFLMKINAIEESDTDGVGNVLGKVSLMRRAKSAVSRSITERKINDKHPLFSVAWDSQKSLSVGKKDSHTIDINVDDDDERGSDTDIPTPAEVKRHMEMFHLKHGQPPANAKLSESRKSKHSKSRSAKTKSNRVAPIDDDLEPTYTRKVSRIRSAKFTLRNENDDDLSPDPLEPWSTKDLLDINKILES